jgi:hypothetical protein
MNKQHTTEPNMTELPEVYSTMPNKWEKWTKTTTNEQKHNLLKNIGFYDSKKPLSTTFLG